MLEYNRVGVSEGIGANKTRGSHDCIICHYWYFSDFNQKYAMVVLV